jgi:hypothetical protein
MWSEFAIREKKRRPMSGPVARCVCSGRRADGWDREPEKTTKPFGEETMSRINLTNLTATQTLSREEMSRTVGGINWNEPGVYTLPRLRYRCYLVRLSRFRLGRVCRWVRG